MDEAGFVIGQMLPTELRDYQLEGIDALSRHYRRNLDTNEKLNRLIFCLPTGGGKTRVAAETFQRALKRMLARAATEYPWDERIVFMVDRTNLVDQASQAFTDLRIPHGVMQARHMKTDPSKVIQVASAQTCEARQHIGGGIPEKTRLLVVDECHAIRHYVNDWIAAHPEVRVLGLTATPFTKGLGRIYQGMVSPITMHQLVERGYLAPIRMFAAKPIDMKGAKTVGGEWTDKEVESRGRVIIADIPTEWEKKTLEVFGGPVKTLVFAPTVAYGRDLCERFQKLGYNFQQISYKGKAEESAAKIAEFRKPDSEIMGLVSCEVFTRGFDVPDVLCGISARPYKKSLTNHIQQLGRVARMAPGKSFALWLDHSGNALRFNRETDDFWRLGPPPLDTGEIKPPAAPELTEYERQELVCSCGFILAPSDLSCKSCGKERVTRTLVRHVAGEMKEVGKVGQLEEFLADPRHVWGQLKALALEKRHGTDARKFAWAQFTSIYNRRPPCDFDEVVMAPVDPRVRQHVKNHLAQYAIIKQWQRNRDMHR